MTAQDRVYLPLLIALGGFLILGVAMTTASLRRAATGDEGERFVITLLWLIHGFYVAAIAVAVLLRVKGTRAAPIVTRALNVLLLALFPFGTALGIYGLIRVDRMAPTPPPVADVLE